MIRAVVTTPTFLRSVGPLTCSAKVSAMLLAVSQSHPRRRPSCTLITPAFVFTPVLSAEAVPAESGV